MANSPTLVKLLRWFQIVGQFDGLFKVYSVV